MLPAAMPTFGLGCHLNARLYTATPSQLELAWRTKVFAISYLGHFF